MNNFCSLVSFEYKKILKRRSFILAVAILLFVCTFCVVGPLVTGDNGFERKEKELISSVAGYFDDEMIADVIEKNIEANAVVDKQGNYPLNIYEKNVGPYNYIRSRLAIALSQSDEVTFKELDALKPTDKVDYYGLRTQKIIERANAKGYSDKELEKTLSLNSKISTPFYYDYANGYDMFLFMMSTSSIFVLFAAAICIAPIFSEEYSRKTDAIILSTKSGKSSLIKAKLFTIFTFTFLFVVIGLLIAVATAMIGYTATGSNVSFQIYNSFSVYPIKMLQSVIIYCVVTTFVAILFSGIVSMLSSMLSAFSTTVVSLLVLFGGMFIDLNIEGLRMMNYFIPSKMVDKKVVFSDRLVDFCGIFVKPYVFIPIVCGVFAIIFAVISHNRFKNHQVR